MTIQTLEQSSSTLPQIQDPPPLNPGDTLSRSEFERRYHAHPEIKKAELVEGVVYMPSPVRFEQHSRPHSDIMTWLGVYRASTPGVTVGDNATVLLDFENEVQPDALLRLSPEAGGQTQINEDDYLEGAPELVVEIAASSAAYDLHPKKRVYARSGVPEYLAIQIYEQRIDWFTLRDGVYQTLTTSDKGVLRSEVFPGLWFNPAAFWADDLAAMLETLGEGMGSEEYEVFVQGLEG